MTDMNSEFLLYTIDTGWSVEIIDGNAILTSHTGATITIYDDYAILEEPHNHKKRGSYYTNLIEKFSKMYVIKWYDDDANMRITSGRSSTDDEYSIFVMFNKYHSPITN